MANLYTSELLSLSDNALDILIDRVEDLMEAKLSVTKYSGAGVELEEIVPEVTYVENGGCPEDKTRIRVYCKPSQVLVDETVKISLDI
jgi:hypothetical protein